MNYDLVAVMLDGMAQQAKVDAETNIDPSDPQYAALLEASMAVRVLADKCRDGESLEIPFGMVP